MAVIAVDLGATKLATAVFDSRGERHRAETVPLAGRQGGEVGELIAGRIRGLLEGASSGGVEIAAVGIAVPGIFRSATGTVWAPNIPGWEDYPLLAEVEAAVADGAARSGGPAAGSRTGAARTAGALVRIDSDRACCILGETRYGAARGARDAIFVAVGTGIGAGILVDGRVLRGHADIAGAIGWLALDRPYRREYVGVGCFEYHASGAGIASVARDLVARDEGYAGPLRREAPEALTAADVFAAYDAGDPVAARVLDSAVELWGMALANLVSLFNPEKVIFGGGVFGPAARFLGRIAEEARKWAQPVSMRQVTVTASALGGEAGLYGAARLALNAARELGAAAGEP